MQGDGVVELVANMTFPSRWHFRTPVGGRRIFPRGHRARAARLPGDQPKGLRSHFLIHLERYAEGPTPRRRAVPDGLGQSPTKQAAPKCLYLVTRSLDPTGRVGRDG